jgi:hypothetical protein
LVGCPSMIFLDHALAALCSNTNPFATFSFVPPTHRCHAERKRSARQAFPGSIQFMAGVPRRVLRLQKIRTIRGTASHQARSGVKPTFVDNPGRRLDWSTKP